LSTTILAPFLAVVVNAAYIPLSEEPGLVKRFGEEYLTYKRNVPRWVPRWTPWDGGFRGDDEAKISDR